MNTPAFISTARVLMVSGSILALSGCIYRREVVYAQPGSPPGEVVVAEPPPQPAPVTEVVTIAPGSGYIWIDGCYEWVGGRWLWYRGHWARPVHPGAVWV